MEPIQLIRIHTGELYANVNGVARGSVGCRFDESGALISHTLYGELPDGLESAIRKAASRGKRTVIPNVTVSMRWTM